MERKPTLTLAFADFWPGFDPRTSFLVRLLSERFELEVARRSRILVFGPFGTDHVIHRGTKVLLFLEPGPLPRNSFDFSLSWDYPRSPRELRFPGFYTSLIAGPGAARSLRERPSQPDWSRRAHFCNFVYSNKDARVRGEFFRELSKRAFVHAPGREENNTPPLAGGRAAEDWQRIKIEYQRSFRFSIAFENASLPGYTTEKLLDALVAGTVPIYWGNPRVGDDVPPGAYINAHDFASLAALADHVMEVEHDDRPAAQYLSAAAEPCIAVDDMTRSVCDLFEEIADYRTPLRTSVIRPVSLLMHGGAIDLVRRGCLLAGHRIRSATRSRS